MKAFFLAFPEKGQTLSGLLRTSALEKGQTSSGRFIAFPLPWSHYVRLLAVKNEEARRFYEREALRGGWTVRQLARQIDTAVLRAHRDVAQQGRDAREGRARSRKTR
jgi:hypothetical protein